MNQLGTPGDDQHWRRQHEWKTEAERDRHDDPKCSEGPENAEDPEKNTGPKLGAGPNIGRGPGDRRAGVFIGGSENRRLTARGASGSRRWSRRRMRHGQRTGSRVGGIRVRSGRRSGSGDNMRGNRSKCLGNRLEGRKNRFRIQLRSLLTLQTLWGRGRRNLLPSFPRRRASG